MNTQTHSCGLDSISPANACRRVRRGVTLLLLSVLVVSTFVVNADVAERSSRLPGEQGQPSTVAIGSHDVDGPQSESAVNPMTLASRDLFEAPAKPDVRSVGRILHSIRSTVCDSAVFAVRRRVAQSFGPHSTPISASPTLLMLGVMLRA